MSWTTPVIVEVCIGMEVTQLRVGRNLIGSAARNAAVAVRRACLVADG